MKSHPWNSSRWPTSEPFASLAPLRIETNGPGRARTDQSPGRSNQPENRDRASCVSSRPPRAAPPYSCSNSLTCPTISSRDPASRRTSVSFMAIGRLLYVRDLVRRNLATARIRTVPSRPAPRSGLRKTSRTGPMATALAYRNGWKNRSAGCTPWLSVPDDPGPERP